jgi:hypothetical protein
MNLFDRPPGAFLAGAPRGPQTLDDLRERYRDLRLLVNLALAWVLVLGTVMDLFIYKQMRLVRTKVNDTRPLVQRMAAEFNRKEPNMRNFVTALQSYAFTYPEFHSVLAKYTNALPQYFASPVRAPAPSPGGTLPRVAAPASSAPQSPRPSGK